MTRESRELRVLLLPVLSEPEPWDLLLPAAAVAEVVRARPLDAPDAGAPEWLCGYLAWRGLRLPLVRVRAVNGPTGRRAGDAYAAVCFAPGGLATAPFFAIESPGMPRLERVTPAALSAEPRPAAVEHPLVQVAVRIVGRAAGLVDLDAVERALHAIAR